MKEYLLICIGTVMVFFSWGLKLNRDPGEVGSLLGYKTRSSLRNEDTWYEANIFAGRWLMLMSVFSLILIASVIYRLVVVETILFWLAGSFLVSILVVYLKTESHLKALFFRDGKRRPRF